jgi:hypothetical protein
VQGGIAVAGTVIVATSTGGDVAAFRAAASPGDRRVSWLWRARLGRSTGGLAWTTPGGLVQRMG